MSIRPPSDIILDVAKNADSSREAAAVRRLESLANGNDERGETFAATLDQFASAPKVIAQTVNAPTATISGHAKTAPKSGDRLMKVAQDFEASLLSPFVNEMMPKDSSAYFGQGNTGDIWKSMLSEQIAHQLAKSGTLGLARHLFATHPIESLRGHRGETPGSTDTVEQTAQTSSQLLSMPISVEIASRTHRI
ncbi:MAG TPA: rod-binding protein [Methylocella sp.]|nr:rod-binding protein [Methylocella sp.]